MKTGDLVRHTPYKSKRKYLKAIYEGAERDYDFSIGVVVKTKKNLSLVYYNSFVSNLSWYENSEIVKIIDY